MRSIKALLNLILAFLFTCSACSHSETQRAAGPFGVNIYLRGTFNEWGLSAPFVYSDQGYLVSLDLDIGKYKFKIADENWKQVDFGLAENKQFVIDAASDLDVKSPNIYFDVSENDSYIFKVVVDQSSKVTLLATKGKVALE